MKTELKVSLLSDYQYFEEKKNDNGSPLKEEKDRIANNIGIYTLMTSGGKGTDVFIKHTNDKWLGVEEGYYMETYLPNKSGGSIDVFTDCPYKNDGEFPVIRRPNWIEMALETYYSLNLDPLLTTIYEKCSNIFVNTCFVCVRGEEFITVKEATVVVPLSSYAKNSGQLKAIMSIVSKDICFIKVKKGEIVSIDMHPTYNRDGENNFLVADKDKGYLTKKLTVFNLSDNEYLKKIKAALNDCDPEKKYTSYYKKYL